MSGLGPLTHIFETSAGVQLIGVFVANLLLGIGMLQTFIYYTSKAKDKLLLKLLPAFLIALSFTSHFMLCTAVYKVLVVDFGDLLSIVIDLPFEPFMANMLQSWVVLGAQMFYVYRIFVFGRSKVSLRPYIWIFPSICVPISVGYVVATHVFNLQSILHGTSAAMIYSPTWIVSVYVLEGVNLFLDSVFVIGMVTLLIYERRSQFNKTDEMLNRLIFLAVNSGLATMIAAILSIIFSAHDSQSSIYGLFHYLIAPLYVNSVLANLNCRDYARGGSNLSSAVDSGISPVAARVQLGINANRFGVARKNSGNADSESQLNGPDSIELAGIDADK